MKDSSKNWFLLKRFSLILPQWLWVLLGHSCIGLGILGIFLPVLPTTPFILLASACYLRGSPKLHQKLRNHPRFGQMLRDWEAGLGIPLKIKILALTMMWTFLSYSAFMVITKWHLQVLLVSIGIGTTIYLYRIPTKKVANSRNKEEGTGIN